ncbi:MAG: DUF554 domain-containing protein [Spirochaetales bacterium]|nr:DUF554 domain-containing protein [Spirochaetales bacterium]
MIATVINALAVLGGSLIGLLLKKGLPEKAKAAVFSAAGLISLVLGMRMALGTTHVLAMALALIIGGLAGTALNIEGAVLRLGEWLKRRFAKGDDSGTFAAGFLDASVLFCVGAMALVGSFKAGVDGDYELILTKSVMDGFMAVILTGALGVGVAFSALAVLVYQGVLTLAAVWVEPWVSELLLAELSAVGGVLVIMIGINLLGLRKIPTADFLPALVLTVGLVALVPFVSFL